MQAAERGVKRLRLHLLTDGRDCTDGSSVKLMQTVVDKCSELEKKGCDAKVASGGGRMKVTMDRYEVQSIAKELYATNSQDKFSSIKEPYAAIIQDCILHLIVP